VTRAALAAILLTGCATATMDRVIDSWKGEDIGTVVKQWGGPASEREIAGGRKLYTWSDVTFGQVACSRTLEVDQRGQVVGGGWVGSSCCSSTIAGRCARLPNPARP